MTLRVAQSSDFFEKYPNEVTRLGDGWRSAYGLFDAFIVCSYCGMVISGREHASRQQQQALEHRRLCP